jgi:hypothetical protein
MSVLVGYQHLSCYNNTNVGTSLPFRRSSTSYIRTTASRKLDCLRHGLGCIRWGMLRLPSSLSLLLPLGYDDDGESATVTADICSITLRMTAGGSMGDEHVGMIE